MRFSQGMPGGYCVSQPTCKFAMRFSRGMPGGYCVYLNLPVSLQWGFLKVCQVDTVYLNLPVSLLWGFLEVCQVDTVYLNLPVSLLWGFLEVCQVDTVYLNLPVSLLWGFLEVCQVDTVYISTYLKVCDEVFLRYARWILCVSQLTCKFAMRFSWGMPGGYCVYLYLPVSLLWGFLEVCQVDTVCISTYL